MLVVARIMNEIIEIKELGKLAENRNNTDSQFIVRPSPLPVYLMTSQQGRIVFVVYIRAEGRRKKERENIFFDSSDLAARILLCYPGLI